MVVVVFGGFGFTGAAVTTFTTKNLRFTFKLSNNAKFQGTNANVLQISGLRATASIRGAGLPAFPAATLAIYGLLQSDMNALTSLQFQPDELERNVVVVEADSSGRGEWATVFSGQIITSGPDYDGIPDAPLRITAQVLGFEALNPATATSYTGSTSVAAIVGSIASKMGYVLENNGVTAQLSSPYFSGTLTQQLRAVKQQSNIDIYIEDNVIAICPAGGVRQQRSFTLSPTSGLVGYPKLDYQRGYVYAKAFFNPAFRFGGPCTIQDSDVPMANGSWIIGTISHDLDSLVLSSPKWFTNLLLYPAGNPPPVS